MQDLMNSHLLSKLKTNKPASKTHPQSKRLTHRKLDESKYAHRDPNKSSILMVVRGCFNIPYYLLSMEKHRAFNDTNLHWSGVIAEWMTDKETDTGFQRFNEQSMSEWVDSFENALNETLERHSMTLEELINHVDKKSL